MSSKYFSSDDLKNLREFFKITSLDVELRPNWGSQNFGYREDLHGDLKKKMAHAYPFSDSSIAHCRSVGGYAFTTYDSNHVISLGFDIEEDSRVSKEVVSRICKDTQEVDLAPSFSSLWTAKEAAFKALKGAKQPQTISSVVLTDWKKLSHFETVRLKDPQQYNYSNVIGLILKKADHSLAFFVAFP